MKSTKSWIGFGLLIAILLGTTGCFFRDGRDHGYDHRHDDHVIIEHDDHR